MNNIPSYFSIIITALLLSGCGSSNQTVQRILLITMDTVRADALHCYDLPLPAANTPNVDQLAADGTLFLRASCNIPATLTSHTSIMTGRLPRSTGVRFAKDQVPIQAETLAETLQMEGFTTAAFLSAAVLNRMYGLDQGLDVYDDLSASNLNAAERSGEETTNRALEWLKSRSANEPFFLWVHYYDAHSPYHPPKEFDHYRSAAYTGKIDGSANQVTQLVSSGGSGLNEADLQQLRALYLGEVEYMDHQIGRLLQGFDAVNSDAGNEDGNNMVIALADHGENLGEHGRFFHGADLHGQSMHIPFIIRWKDKANAGSKVDTVVQGIDVMPTVLTACGIAIPDEVEGMDLHPLLMGLENDNRIALHETENEYRSDADKIFAAESLQGRLLDKRFHRRSPVFVGKAMQLEITESCFLQAWVKGDSTTEMAAHIRFHTPESWLSKNVEEAATLPSIMVRTSRFGIESIHQQYPNGDNSSNPDWVPVATPDLLEHAKSYGSAQGWNFTHIVLESVVVDVSGVPGQTRVDALIDQAELRGKQTLVIDDFDRQASRSYQDSGVGTKRVSGSQIEKGVGMNNSNGLHVAAAFEPDENIWQSSEYFHFKELLLPYNENNLLIDIQPNQYPEEVKSLANELAEWLTIPAGQSFNASTIDPAQEEKLRSLGYF